MKCLVTGGCGFIGSHIVDRLIDDGHEVIVLDNFSANNETFYMDDRAMYVKQDIANYPFTRTFYDGVDVVFHLAAESRVQPAIENPIQAFEKNVLGTAVVLQCAREYGVKRVVYSTTSAAYGLNEPPNVETDETDCLNPYSVSKVAGEEVCKMYSNLYGLETVCLRYFNVFGKRAPDAGQYAPVTAIFNRQKKAGEPLTIVGDGKQSRDFVHVQDIVEANLLAATAELKEFGEVFNVGSGTNYTIQEIADTIDSANQKYLPPREGEAYTTLADISKIKSVLGWEPKINLLEWIKNGQE